MKVSRSVLFVLIVVIASTVAAVAHLTDETFDIPALRVHG
jgi:archaellum component FlaG (FlaF/FlaG flagellin family)